MLKNKRIKIGILAFQGGVIEHQQATLQALKNLKIDGDVVLTRTKEEVKNLDALIIPGGESTVFYKLVEEAGIFQELKKIKNIFGTCAGAIFLAKNIKNKIKGQKSLSLMNIEVDRNAYGAQGESFEENIKTKLGIVNAVFIRAPKIKSAGKSVYVLAGDKKNIIACEERGGGRNYLATCFHPELSTTKFHEYFIKNLVR
jgi:5'-phosphate synthase pdxT subunit